MGSKRSNTDVEGIGVDTPEDAILGEADEFGEEELVDTFNEDFEDVFEETLLPNGEHELIILKMSIEKSKKNPLRKMLHVVFESTQVPTASEIHDYMLFESSGLGDSSKQMNRRKLRRVNFYAAFDIDTRLEVSCAEAAGLTGYAIIATEDDAQYGKQNKIKEYSAGE